MAILLISFLGDLIWMFYWVPFWWGGEGLKWQVGLHSFVILCSFINFMLKIPILVMIGITDKEVIQNAAAPVVNQVNRFKK